MINKSNNDTKKASILFEDFRIIYIDIQYYQAIEDDHKNKMSVFSIQYAEITANAIINNQKPDLNVLFIWNYDNEQELFKDYFRILGGFTGKIIIIGVLNILEITSINMIYSKLKDKKIVKPIKSVFMDIDRQTTGLIDPKTPEKIEEELKNKNKVQGILKKWFIFINMHQLL